jgi:quinol monooxygenase YgiN
MLKVGLLVILEAKPGKEAELERFLVDAQPLAAAEPATAMWHALRLGPSSFAIVDAFADDRGRAAHLEGPIAAALMARASELLASPPDIRRTDVLAFI